MMRGGRFNFKKYFAYNAVVYLLAKLKLQSALENEEFEANPLVKAQALFVDPFNDKIYTITS